MTNTQHTETYTIVETSADRRTTFTVMAHSQDGRVLGGDFHWFTRANAERAAANYAAGIAVHGNSTERQALR